ncbi:MAG: sigma-54 interaction domain-containing protein [bacterium]
MNNISQVYIVSRQKDICDLIKRALIKTVSEKKITELKNIKGLPSNFNSDTYIITEYNAGYIAGVSKITPKRNIKLYVYVNNIFDLNERDIIFLIKHNIDHIIHPKNIDKLNYEKFIDAKIFKKKHYNAFIDKASTLLEELCHNNDDIADTGVNIYGISSHIKSVIEKTCKIAQSESSVLITGESGTGKELIARLIHNKSRRNSNPMVSVNCGAFPEGLLESELFGYKKGAFTGAFTDKQGRFDLADKSTLFLDEIGDMSLSLQVKLLRVIQEREIEPIGSLKTKKIDARIISATNKNLEEMISKNLFREDFYYRINVIPVHLIPLRERKPDIIVLIYYFLKKFGDFQNNQVYGISEDAFNVLLNYSWNGNVRELENLMEMLVVLNESGLIAAKDIPEKYFKDNTGIHLEKEKPVKKNSPDDFKFSGKDFRMDLKKEMEKTEMDIINNAMNITGGVKEKAAKMLGLNRTTLIEKLKRYEKNKKK